MHLICGNFLLSTESYFDTARLLDGLPEGPADETPEVFGDRHSDAQAVAIFVRDGDTAGRIAERLGDVLHRVYRQGRDHHRHDHRQVKIGSGIVLPNRLIDWKARALAL